MDKAALLILSAALLAGVASAQNIVAMEAKTADVADAGMTLGSVDFQITLYDFTSCQVTGAGHSGVNFQQGVIDFFSGDELDTCNNFNVPSKDIALFTVSHHGSDAWTGEYLSVFFNDSTFIHCPLGVQLDGGASTTITCSAYPGP